MLQNNDFANPNHTFLFLIFSLRLNDLLSPLQHKKDCYALYLNTYSICYLQCLSLGGCKCDLFQMSDWTRRTIRLAEAINEPLTSKYFL